MKKVLFCLVAMTTLLTGCVFETGTGEIEWGMAKEGTSDQLESGNYIGTPLRYFSAFLEEFVNDGNCVKVSDTFSGGKVFTDRAMTATELKLFVRIHKEIALREAAEKCADGGYPVASHKTTTFRIRYKIATREEWEVTDEQIPVEYYATEQDRAEAEDK